MTSSPLSVSGVYYLCEVVIHVNVCEFQFQDKFIICSKNDSNLSDSFSLYHLRFFVFITIQIAGISGHHGRTAVTGNAVSTWEPRHETELVSVKSSHHSELNPALQTVTRRFPAIPAGVLMIVLWVSIGESKGGGEGGCQGRAPFGSNFLKCSCCFGEIGQNNRLMPPIFMVVVPSCGKY